MKTPQKFVFTLCCYSVLLFGGTARLLAAADDQAKAAGWKIKFDGSGSSPVIAGGVLYVGSADGAVYALDPATGENKWRFQTGEGLPSSTSGANIIVLPRKASLADGIQAAINAREKQGEGKKRVDATPAIENGTVFITSGDLSLYAIDAATGKKRWSYDAGSEIFSSAALNNGAAFFTTRDGLHAIDASTGKKKWTFATLQEIPVEQMNAGKRPPEGMTFTEDAIYVTAWPTLGSKTPVKSFLYAVDPASGQAKWVINVDGLDIIPPKAAKGLVYFAVEDPGAGLTDSSHKETLFAVSAKDGTIKWKVGAERQFGTARLLITQNSVCFATDKRLLVLDPETGRQLWTFTADEIHGPASDGQRLYIVTHKGSMNRPKDTLHALSLANGEEQWSGELGGNVFVYTIADGVLYAGGNRLYALDAATGKELWSFKDSGCKSMRSISGGRIFLVSPTIDYIGSKRVDQGYLCAIDAKTGKLKP